MNKTSNLATLLGFLAGIEGILLYSIYKNKKNLTGVQDKDKALYNLLTSGKPVAANDVDPILLNSILMRAYQPAVVPTKVRTQW